MHNISNIDRCALTLQIDSNNTNHVYRKKVKEKTYQQSLVGFNGCGKAILSRAVSSQVP